MLFTGSTDVEIVSATTGNITHPQHPGFENFGQMLLHGDGGEGYVRLDWFTPDALPTWGDGRLTILGTNGYIELRKYVDVAGRPGGDHLFLVDGHDTRYVDCTDVRLPFYPDLIRDIADRTETAIGQEHTFAATGLAIRASDQAFRAGYLRQAAAS